MSDSQLTVLHDPISKQEDPDGLGSNQDNELESNVPYAPAQASGIRDAMASGLDDSLCEEFAVRSQPTQSTENHDPGRAQENIQSWLKYQNDATVPDPVEDLHSLPTSEHSLRLRAAEVPLPGPSNSSPVPTDIASPDGRPASYVISSPSLEHASMASIYSTPPHSARRPNPKQNRQARSGQSDPGTSGRSDQILGLHKTTAPSNITELDFKKTVPGLDGAPLYHLSDSVPYLLGSERQVEGLQTFHRLSLEQMSLTNLLAKERVDAVRLGDKDKTLLSVLLLANRNVSDEAHTITSAFDMESSQVKLWKEVGDKGCEEIFFSFQKLCSRIKDWQTHFPDENPRESEHWKTILEELAARETPIEYVPASSFKQILSASPDEQGRLLDRARDIARAGMLADRNSQRRGRSNNTFSYYAPQAQDPSAPYALRFSHATPLGALEANNTQPQPAATVSAKTDVKTAPKKKAKNNQCTKFTKWTVSGILATGVVGAILILCYFRLGQKRKGWNQE